MAFWKKSDDPWDRKPVKTTYTTFEEEPREEKKGLFQELRDDILEERDLYLEKREQKKAAAEAEAAMPPEKCPWCGKDMEKGYLSGYRGGAVEWAPKKPGALFGNAFTEETVVVTTEGSMSSYKTCWYCRDCSKMTLTITPYQGPNYSWEGGKVTLPEEEEANHDL